jgi:hypothetical protein
LQTEVKAFRHQLPLAGQINFMRRQLSFFLLLSSWICGVFLICLFPPVSDFSQNELESGLINQELAPELTLKNSSRSRSSFQIGQFVDLEFFVSDSILVSFDPLVPLTLSANSIIPQESPTSFRLFFRLFFETF